MQWRNPYINDEFFQKQTYDIVDLSNIVQRGTRIIRLWEQRGIIHKPPDRDKRGWRLYTRKSLAFVLEEIINYKWKHEWGLDFDELIFLVQLLKGEYIVGNQYYNHSILRYRKLTKDKRPRKYSQHLR